MMMRRLALDVIHDGCLVRTAHAESPISFLPGECDSMLTDPSRGIRFQDLDRPSRSHVGRKRNEQMTMIRDAACGEHWNPEIPAYSAKVFPEPRKQFVRNNVSAFFGAEHAMNEDVRIFVSHPTSVHIA